jgi:uncharacterized protein YutD
MTTENTLCISLWPYDFLCKKRRGSLTMGYSDIIYIYIYIYIEWRYRELKLTEAFRELNSKNISNHFEILIYHSH